MGKSEITIKTLWGTAKSPELKLTDEELHLIVEQKTGKASIRELNKGEIVKVCNYLYELKHNVKKNRKEYRKPGTGNEATVNQRKKIWKLAEEIGWNQARVNGLCKRMFRIEVVEWLNYRQCSDLIEAMKAIASRVRKESGDEKNSETV